MADFSIVNINGVATTQIEIYIPRVSWMYPNLFISISYALNPKTGLFYSDGEKDIDCEISPYGFCIFQGFSQVTKKPNLTLTPDSRILQFSDTIKISLSGGTAKAGTDKAGVEEPLPATSGLVKVWGEVYHTGYRWAKAEERG